MIVQTASVVCDGCGRHSHYSAAPTGDEAWARAESTGWTRAPIEGSDTDEDHHCSMCTVLWRMAERRLVGLSSPS